MSLLLQVVKYLTLLVLIIAITIPIRYKSTNSKYLFIRCLHSILSIKHSLISDPIRPELSADYRAFENLLKLNSKFQFDPLTDPLVIVKHIRSSVSFADLIPKSNDCRIEKEIFEYDNQKVDTFWVNHRRNDDLSNKTLVYFHGGGYILGDIHFYAGIECHLSRLFNLVVVHIEYRLSPEHPAPAAVQDSLLVYRALLKKNSSQFIFMGDSAGGGLALLTIQSIIQNQLPVPNSVIVLSPWADLSLSADSYTRNALTELQFSHDDFKWLVKQILGSNSSQLSANNAIVSPLFGSFEGFPSMYVNVGTGEILEDDARAVVKKAEQSGVNVTFEIGLHMLHVYPIYFLYYPEARQALDHIHHWIETNYHT